MIDIDGSRGEGGGQILRTSIALSAVTGEEVRIRNIRANRPNPGLAPSHITSIEAVARICDGEVDNLFAGSREIVFRPGQLTGGRFEFDVGTAGSISLVLQSCLVPAALSKARVTIRVIGGTDVKWSPPIDFMRLVHLPILDMFGPSCDLDITARGFYPEGGGEVTMDVSPAGKLTPIDIPSRGDVLRIEGVAFAQNLPEHVVKRTKHSALKRLVDFRQVKVDSDLRKGRSTGAGIVLCAVCENTFLGSSVLGEKGLRAEELGEGCAQDLLEMLGSGATVDEHMLDQIVPYMALAEGPSRVSADEVTPHAETNMSIVEAFLGRRFETKKLGGLVEIRTD